MNRRERRQAGQRHGDVGLALDFESTWCLRHLAPLDGEPPAVAVAAMGFLLTAFLAHPEIQTETHGGLIFECGDAVDRHRPLCCFLGTETVEQIYADARTAGR